MKLKNIYLLFIAMFVLMTSCENESQITLLDEIQVSSSYVAIPEAGGSVSITVIAKESWTVENSENWLSISATNGNVGETKLTFSADLYEFGRSTEVLIKSAGKTQRINVIQGLVIPSDATCADVIAGPDGKSFRVTGICTSIDESANGQLYGNWYLTDETGTVYIYGTLSKAGKTKDNPFKSWELEVGDEVTVEGPKLTYGTTIELVDVTIVKINKWAIKVDSISNDLIPAEGGIFEAFLTHKGQGVSVDIPEDAKSWLSISSIQSAGTNAVVKFQATANTGEGRSTTITFRTTDGKKEYSEEVTLTQIGAVFEISMKDLIAIGAGGDIPIGAKLVAVLTSDPDGGNSTSKKNLVFTALDNMSGITARLTADNTTLVMGDKVEIDLTGASISEYSGQLQLGVANDKVTKIGTATITPRVATIAELTSNMAAYNFCVVTTEGTLSGEAATWLKGDAHTTNKLTDGDVHLDIYVSKYATWGTENMPTTRVKVTGIAQAYGVATITNQLIIRNLSDVVSK